MRWLRYLWECLLEWRREISEPFDFDFPDSEPALPDDCLDCPDTQPTSPGALDTLPARLE